MDSARLGQRPLLVCINNDKAARPQYGFPQADVVYEYLMEGNAITRFTAIYWGQDAERIGPVRSARLINYYMTSLYDGALVASGASDRVRYILKREAPFPYLDIDLDDPANNRYTFSLGRDYRTRLQTSTAGLRQWLARIEREGAPRIRGFTFGDTPAGAPGNRVHIPYPPSSVVDWIYDPGSGRYLRLVRGNPTLDGASGQQISAANVVVQFVPHEITDIIEDSLGSRGIRINLYGEGRAIVLRDGVAVDGRWRSPTRGHTPEFFDAAGNPVPLKPGNMWIQVVPTHYEVVVE